MSKVCNICGSEIPDSSDYCILCDKIVSPISKEAYEKATKEGTAEVSESDIVEMELLKRGTKINTLQKRSLFDKIKQYIYILLAVVVIAGIYYYVKYYAINTYEKSVSALEESIENKNRDDFYETFVPGFCTKYNDEMGLLFAKFESYKLSHFKMTVDVDDEEHLASKERTDMVNTVHADIDEGFKVRDIYKFKLTITFKDAERIVDKYEKIMYSVFDGKNWYLYFEH